MTAPHRQDTPAHFCSKLIRPWPKVAAIILGLLIVAGVVWARPGAARPGTATVVPRIAVLPVEAPPGVLNAGLAEIGQVLTESIIGKLRSMTGRHAVVLTRTDTAGLRGEDRTLAGVVRLGAEYLVDVSLRPTAGPIRVHAQLANVSGSIMWSTDYDLELTDLESLQLSVAQRIARRVAEQVVPSATRTASIKSSSPSSPRRVSPGALAASSRPVPRR